MFGKTPIVYLTMLRVREMARLLRGTDLPVATATNSRPHNGRTLPRGYSGQGSIIQLWVELRGIEPLTFSMRTMDTAPGGRPIASSPGVCSVGVVGQSGGFADSLCPKCVHAGVHAAACYTTAAASDRQSMTDQPSLLDLLRRARAQFHVGLGTISAADAEEIRQRQEARRPGVWYARIGVERSR